MNGLPVAGNFSKFAKLDFNKKLVHCQLINTSGLNIDLSLMLSTIKFTLLFFISPFCIIIQIQQYPSICKIVWNTSTTSIYYD